MNNIIRWGRNIVTVFGIYYAITNALWGWILLSIAIWFFIVQPFGLVIGRHKYLVHRSFEARNNFIHIWLMNLIYSIEALNGAGTNLNSGIAAHLQHHVYSDVKGKDPVSPWTNGWWMNMISRPWYRYEDWIKDKASKVWDGDWFIKFINEQPYFTLFIIPLVLAIFDPMLIVYAWVIPLFMGAKYQMFCDNLSHGSMFNKWWWGSRNFKVKAKDSDVEDRSSNFAWFGFIPFDWGDGLHNNHHRYGDVHTTAYKKGEYDPSGWIIRTFLAKPGSYAFIPDSYLEMKNKGI